MYRQEANKYIEKERKNWMNNEMLLFKYNKWIEKKRRSLSEHGRKEFWEKFLMKWIYISHDNEIWAQQQREYRASRKKGIALSIHFFFFSFAQSLFFSNSPLDVHAASLFIHPTFMLLRFIQKSRFVFFFLCSVERWNHRKVEIQNYCCHRLWPFTSFICSNIFHSETQCFKAFRVFCIEVQHMNRKSNYAHNF